MVCATEMALRLFTVNRWVITGTPIGRFGVHDLYGLCLFVQQFPLANQETFRLYQSAAARRGPLGWRSTLRALAWKKDSGNRVWLSRVRK